MYDVLIIGGGPAGLSAALGLARQTYSALVFDSQNYRNAPTSHMHNVVTWDHRPPAEFRAAARENIQSRYNSISFKNTTIEVVARKDDGTFEAIDNEKVKYQGKKLVLATGVSDMLPEDIKGFRDLWGKSIFHCLFCHGYEERGAKSAGVLAAGFLTAPPMVLHMARMATNLAEEVTIYCHGNQDLTAQFQKELEGKGVPVDGRKIVSVERCGDNGESVKLHFEDGSTKQERFLVNVPNSKLNGTFHEQLGLETDPMAFIKSKPPFNETDVPGVFVAGDCGTMFKAVPQAISGGMFASGGLVAQLAAMGRF